MNAKSESFTAWKDKILFWSTTALVTGAVTWSAWVTLEVSSHPNRSEVESMIQQRAPYIQDRKAIMDQLQRIEDSEEKALLVIERNTEAITGLKVELAKLSGGQLD